nr:MAG TPA: hypothetical protein [Caudoviricetes sp.]
MSVPRTEQETVLVFNAETKRWTMHSTYPPHMRKWRDLIEDVASVNEDGAEVSVEGDMVDGLTVSLRKKRVMSEEQRQLAGERLAKLRVTAR